MANEIRRRYNFMSGTIDDNPLSNSATTLNSTELAGLPAISASEYAVLVLDPTGEGNGPEVVYVTAHTGSATSATITRGREGTSKVQHASTITWVHVATAADFTLVGDDNDEPSTGGLPYEGQTYVDTTNDEYQIYNGSEWSTGFQYGAWSSWTPTITQSGAVAKTVNYGKYARIGRTIIAQCQATISGSGSAGSIITVSLPATTAAATDTIIGTADFFDQSGGVVYRATARVSSGGTTAYFLRTDSTGTGSVGADPNFGLASSDTLTVSLTFEAAS